MANIYTRLLASLLILVICYKIVNGNDHNGESNGAEKTQERKQKTSEEYVESLRSLNSTLADLSVRVERLESKVAGFNSKTQNPHVLIEDKGSQLNFGELETKLGKLDNVNENLQKAISKLSDDFKKAQRKIRITTDQI